MEKSVYEVIQIDERSWRIEENGVRSFLFTGANKALLVDSGFGTGNLRETVESLTKLPVMLVNTHADRDHLGCNKQFSKAFMHPAEFDRYHQAMGKEFVAGPVWESDVIDLGGRCFEVVLIPGHTPGSIALLDAENKILISGDSVQTGMIFMFGAGRNIAAYINSMDKLSRMRGRFDTLYPSHGSFPANAEIIDGLINGAKQIRDGKIEGMKPPFETPAEVYDVGVAKFLYK